MPRAYTFSLAASPDQSPVPDLNNLGTDGYRIVATVGQLLLLEGKVKGDDNDEEEREAD